jgi:ABC-type bacteriocin/lantibiotic exporter with double-glycine peptidase domain
VNGLALSLVRQHGRALLMGAALMVIGRAAVLAVPAIAKFVFDDVITGGRTELLLPLAAATFAAMLIVALTGWLLTLVVGGAAEATVTRLRADLQRHVLRLPLDRVTAERVGTLVPRIMTDPAGVRSLVGTGVIQLAGGTLTIIVGSAVLLYLDWRLTLGTLVLLAAFAAATGAGVGRLRRIHGDIATSFADLSGLLTETLSGLHVVRGAGAEPREQRVFHDGATLLERHTTRSLLSTSLLAATAGITAGGISVVLMVVGGQAVLRGDMTPGELLWFVMTMGIVARPLGSLAAASAQITHALAGLDRTAVIFALPVAEPDRPAAPRQRAIAGAVDFEHVSYSYDTGETVLRDISFRAEPGTLTVILGANGAGKTTLLQLLLALRRPDTGIVRIDGRDLRDIDLRGYRRQLGFMLQDSLLVHGTIRDNIAYPLEHASHARVRRAAEAAGAHAFIEQLPAGYETPVGERGAGLSAGQRQRIALARALIAEPRILLLDEPTASLDSAGAAAVLHDLLRCREGRTTFFVTHDLDAVRAADQVLTLEHGNLLTWSDERAAG